MDFTLIVALVIALALIFDFTNGYHDTANAMATPIATGAMRPKVAVGLAAILNLVGAFLSTEVARTISGGIINKDDAGVQITPEIIFAGLIGAIVWNLITWLRGLPSSSSHALFGGLIGATIIGVGSQAVAHDVVLAKVILPALIAPLTVGIVAYLATRFAYFITRRDSGKADGRGGFRYAQIISSSLVALAHGTNDAQKTMGVITLTLIAGGMQDVGTGPQLWVITTCAIAIAIGTYTGGWRIIRTMGRGLTDIKPAQGFAAETSTAATILASSQLGFALSTTQVASGSVIGSGLGRRGSTVRWGMAGQIALGWVLTLPAAAIMGAFAAGLALIGPMGIVLDLVIGSLVIAVLFRRSRQSRVTHDNLHDIDDAGRVVKIRKTPRKASRTASRKDQKKVAL
ncbi:inorganic phosphate transporter [Cryobacterium sp. M96]|uniref:inorganic phosphate transporter n=1 Tax=Cryobacterium sp. M96 TaxID=2048295 RepID=UPI000CE2CF27|nr:inorganic phosphate transporter [Cryobacterium sp. M96]